MLSEKEILELTERAMGHLALVQKFELYETLTADAEIRQLLQRQREQHSRHYQMVMGFIDGSQLARSEQLDPVDSPR